LVLVALLAHVAVLRLPRERDLLSAVAAAHDRHLESWAAFHAHELDPGESDQIGCVRVDRVVLARVDHLHIARALSAHELERGLLLRAGRRAVRHFFLGSRRRRRRGRRLLRSAQERQHGVRRCCRYCFTSVVRRKLCNTRLDCSPQLPVRAQCELLHKRFSTISLIYFVECRSS
jgi:hypothetical protein